MDLEPLVVSSFCALLVGLVYPKAFGSRNGGCSCLGIGELNGGLRFGPVLVVLGVVIFAHGSHLAR
jgi:hypothetical protein